MTKIKIVCGKCGSEEVSRDATASEGAAKAVSQ
jgi:hypothetical protein